MKKRKLLLINSILLSIYLIGSLPYYLIANEENSRFVLFSTIYVAFVLIHEAFIAGALIFQWSGYIKQKRGLIRFSSFIMFLGGFAFIISFVILIPIMIINMISKGKRKKKPLID